MADFPYTPNPASLRRFFEHIQTAGVPQAVTIRYLESVGFKTKNDRYILSLLKAIKFADEDGKPIDNWQRYRNKQSASGVMASALRTTYRELFTTYPDAHRKDNEALRNYFSTHTTVGEVVLNLIVRTFRTLCEMADFDAVGGTEPVLQESTSARHSAAIGALPSKSAVTSGMTVNINIQLQIPATEDASVYEKFFAAMKKHLLSENE